MRSSIYTIGHGQKDIGQFIEELKAFDIAYLIDVRSVPFSKWAPHFNRGTIDKSLHEAGIRYGYMGDTLGGRPLNDECYDEEGYFDYKKMAETQQFKEGLSRLVNANAQHLNIALMCSESEPSECHRSKLIGRELFFKFDIPVYHIISKYKGKTQVEIMMELDKNHGGWHPATVTDGTIYFEEFDTAGNIPPYFKSRKAYRNMNSYNTPYNY